MDRLNPFDERVGAPPAPGPEHKVELLLNHRRVRGVTRYLVRWRGHTSADGEWLLEEELVYCRDKVAEYCHPPPRRRRRLRRGGRHFLPPRRWWSLQPASGCRLPPRRRRAHALVGRTVLYYWPGDGWVRGTAARRSRTQRHSHVVRYGPRSALGAAVVDLLLDAASHGPPGRWVLLCPAR